ncbi:MAG: SGNH/GDSL hydrolase family protein [Verrucomicrobiota bacterium]
MKATPFFVVALFLAFAGAASGSAAERPGTPFRLPGELASAKRVVVLGDSITYGGTYVDFVEMVVRQADPTWRGEILDLGLPSETVSGLSEDGHAGGKFPRPDLHERLDRTLAQTKPDLVLACYGMNDGIYHPFSEERFERFRSGIVRLHDKVVASGAAIIHLTPPVFDAQPIRDKVLPVGLVAYPKPFAGYDDVLARYAVWLLEQRAKGWQVIDVHGPMRRELEARRRTAPEFTFAKDGVHADRFGHAAIARAILAEWKFPAAAVEAPMGWAAERDGELLQLIQKRRKLLSDAWLTAIGHKRPMTPGRPLEEATREAAVLTEKIAAVVFARGAR